MFGSDLLRIVDCGQVCARVPFNQLLFVNLKRFSLGRADLDSEQIPGRSDQGFHREKLYLLQMAAFPGEMTFSPSIEQPWTGKTRA